MKRLLLTLAFVFPMMTLVVSASTDHSESSILSSFQKLSPKQLNDTANHYFLKSSYDTALIAYNLLIKTSPSNPDLVQQKRIFFAYNNSACIYEEISDYRAAYDYLIKALQFCEKYMLGYEYIVHANIGNIYSNFKHYKLAKQYKLKALNSCRDSLNLVYILSNLSLNETYGGMADSAFYYVDRAVQINKQLNYRLSDITLSALGAYYRSEKLYDSAAHYFRESLNAAKRTNSMTMEIELLSDLANLFLETNKIDSALHYVSLSNDIASENGFLHNMAENYLTLSNIEKSKGRYKRALELYQLHSNLKDSIYNGEVFGDVNQMQRLHEVAKTNEQIEQLVFEKEVKQRTIHYRTGILAIAIVVLLVVFFQNRRLNRANKALIERNLEIISLEKQTAAPQWR
jgi:tetratricopeptide (TPR) repeat protein